MRRILVTIDIGNFQRPNSRASFEAAAFRWGAEFLAYTQKPLGDAYCPSFTKAFLDDFTRGYEEVAFFDADCVIRSDAPSPFVLIEPEKIKVVRNGNERIGNYPNTLMQHHYNLMRLNQQHRMLEKIENVQEYFNTGCILADIQTLRRLCHLIRSLLPELAPDKQNPIYEQALFNYAARCMSSSLDDKIFQYIEECWNYMYPASRTIQTEWVYHISNDIQDRNQIIDKLTWSLK